MSAQWLMTGDTTKGQSPLVTVGIAKSGDRFTVDCKACGSCVQFTEGQGGYIEPETAQVAAQTHRLEHIRALMTEAIETDPGLAEMLVRAILEGLKRP